VAMYKLILDRSLDQRENKPKNGSKKKFEKAKTLFLNSRFATRRRPLARPTQHERTRHLYLTMSFPTAFGINVEATRPPYDPDDTSHAVFVFPEGLHNAGRYNGVLSRRDGVLNNRKGRWSVQACIGKLHDDSLLSDPVSVKHESLRVATDEEIVSWVFEPPSLLDSPEVSDIYSVSLNTTLIQRLDFVLDARRHGPSISPGLLNRLVVKAVDASASENDTLAEWLQSDKHHTPVAGSFCLSASLFASFFHPPQDDGTETTNVHMDNALAWFECGGFGTMVMWCHYHIKYVLSAGLEMQADDFKALDTGVYNILGCFRMILIDVKDLSISLLGGRRDDMYDLSTTEVCAALRELCVVDESLLPETRKNAGSILSFIVTWSVSLGLRPELKVMLVPISYVDDNFWNASVQVWNFFKIQNRPEPHSQWRENPTIVESIFGQGAMKSRMILRVKHFLPTDPDELARYFAEGAAA